MLNRRDFLTQGLCAGITTFTLSRWSPAQEPTRPQYELTRDVPTRLFDGKKCWSHPRAGIVPAAGTGRQPRVVMTMNTLDLSGSDVFKAMHGLHTDDLGQTWTEPKPQEALAVRHETL
ncbi:MAG: exo-alpha-sialidase, partial [Pirellulaceae bacterium]